MLKKMLPHMLMVLILAISLSLPGLVSAFPHRSPDNDSYSCPMKTIFYELLEITDEQDAELENLREETRDKIEPLGKEIKELNITETLLAENIDNDTAKAKLQEMVDLESEIYSISADARLEGALILDGEQRQTIDGYVSPFIDLIEYIKDYPGWEDIEKVIEEIKPFFDDTHSQENFLDLTEEQETELEELKNVTHDKTKDISKQIKDLDIFETLLAETIDVDNATKKLQEMVDLETEIAAVSADARLKAAHILTPEQRQTILNKMEQRKRWPRRHRYRFPGYRREKLLGL